MPDNITSNEGLQILSNASRGIESMQNMDPGQIAAISQQIIN